MRLWRWLLIKRVKTPKDFKLFQFRRAQTQSSLACSRISLAEASPTLKKKLSEALDLKGIWDGIQRELSQVVAELKLLNDDHDRIRKNLRETPKEAEVYRTYLKKLSDQEKEIDTLITKQKNLMTEHFSALKKYEDYLANISD